MKKSTLLLGIALTFLFGCKKMDSNQLNPVLRNQSSSTTSGNQKGNSANAALYQLKFDNNSVLSVAKIGVALPTTKIASDGGASRSSVSPHHAMCNFSLPGGFFSDQSNVILNNGGIHGAITISGTFACQMTSLCLEVVGNEAIYTGVITSVQNDGGVPSAIAVGNDLIFRVIDNGEGANAPASQMSSSFYYLPGGGLDCSIDLFSLSWPPYINIAPGGFIHVM